MQTVSKSTEITSRSKDLVLEEIAGLALGALEHCRAQESADIATQILLERIGLLADRFSGYKLRGSADAWMLSPVLRDAAAS